MEDRTEQIANSPSAKSVTEQSAFKRFLTNFGRVFNRSKSSPLPLDSENHDVVKQKKQEVVSKLGIAHFIQEELEKRGLKPPEFKSAGASGFSHTNERAIPEFFEQLRNQQIDGYLIGVGVSSIFSFFEAYPESKIPKGIVLCNVDPQCTTDGSFVVQNLEEGKVFSRPWSSWDLCYEQNYGEKQLEQYLDIRAPYYKTPGKYPEERRRALEVREGARREWLEERKKKDQESHQVVEEESEIFFDSDDIISRHFSVARPEFIDYLLRHPQDYEKFVYENGRMPTVTEPIMAKHLATLQKLTQEGSIAIIQQDLFNPELLEILSRLPDLKDSNNLIYLSNVADWLVRAAKPPVDYSELFAPYSNLKILDPTPPHNNLYVDTLGHLGYQLRFHPQIPDLEKDFTSARPQLS